MKCGKDKAIVCSVYDLSYNAGAANLSPYCRRELFPFVYDLPDRLYVFDWQMTLEACPFMSVN